jgi:hypothetical protein
MKAVAREPLFHFLALGLLIWLGGGYWHAHHDRHTIHIGSAHRRRIAAAYLRQFGQAPTPGQVQGLLERYIREEIFLREGLALQLDQDDEIVRRRIVQKYEFLQTDLRVPQQPDPGSLERWFEKNKQRYLVPERVAFTQVYFTTDQHGTTARHDDAHARALQVLEKLRRANVPRAAEMGDPFPGPSDPGALGPEDAARLFGESEVAAQLFQVPVGYWEGPLRSGYGWHLVYVVQRQPPQLPPLQDIRERVLADYQAEQLDALKTAAFDKLRAQYHIVDDSLHP